MPNCTTDMTTQPPPFVFKSILPHVVLAIVLVVLLISHFVHHHFNYTLRKHHRPSVAIEEADVDDGEADPKGLKTNKMVMVVSPMKTRSDNTAAARNEPVEERNKGSCGSRIEVMEYAAPLQRNLNLREDSSSDDTSVTDTEEMPPHRTHSGPNGTVSMQSIQSGGRLQPTSRSVSQSNLTPRMGSSGFVDTVPVADRQTALDDAELTTPVGSTNALNMFDQMPEPTSKLGHLAEVKSRLTPAPLIQINERHTVL